MADFNTTLGWCLLVIAAIFAFGVAPRFARHIYPGAPGVGTRLAAPAIFATMAAACFAGRGFEALVLTLVIGIPVSARWRWQRRHVAVQAA